MMRCWCRTCGEPVTASGDSLIASALHEATGLAKGPDGHIAVATDEDPVLRKEANEIEAEFDSRFTVSVRWGFFRADWANLPPGKVTAHYTADDAESLRKQLAAAVRGAARR
jgi:hypothetical protein